MQFLAMKSRVDIQPPGEFEKEDIVLGNTGDVYKKEVYATLEVRYKWNKIVRNLKVGYILCYGRRRVGTIGQWVE